MVQSRQRGQLGLVRCWPVRPQPRHRGRLQVLCHRGPRHARLAGNGALAVAGLPPTNDLDNFHLIDLPIDQLLTASFTVAVSDAMMAVGPSGGLKLDGDLAYCFVVISPKVA